MTREEMLKTNWRPYMIVHYEPGHGSELCHEMIVIGIEFDDECVHLVPIDDYEHEEFYINIHFIKIPAKNKNTMRVITMKKPKLNTRLKEGERSSWSMYKKRNPS